MPFCPRCKSEYREGFSICAECQMDLVESLDDVIDVDDQREEIVNAEIDSLWDQGNAAFDGEDYIKAVKLFTQVVAMDGEDVDAFIMLALSYSNLDLILEAWRSFKFALHQDDEDAETLFYAAEFLSSIGNNEMALGYLSRSLDLERDEERLRETRDLKSIVETEIASGHTKGIDLSTELDLTHIISTCKFCSTALPLDAPFCYNCGEPHIYSSGSWEGGHNPIE